MKKYKVVEIRKQGLSGHAFDGATLEALLNEQAAEGWSYERLERVDAKLMEGDLYLLVFSRRVAGADASQVEPDDDIFEQDRSGEDKELPLDELSEAASTGRSRRRR